MNFTIRPFAGEFAAITSLVNLISPEPTTPEKLAGTHSGFPATGLRRRMVAMGAGGAIIGYANAACQPDRWPGVFWVTLVVAPAARGQGVGSALYADLAAWTAASGATALRGSMPDDDEAALQFGQKRGFAPSAHTLESRLNVPAFDETPFAGVVEQAEAAGIRFFAYPTVAGEESMRRVYELYKVTDLDSPGYAGTDPDKYPPYEEWYRDLFGGGRVVEEGLILAADGDRWVGMTLLQTEGTEGGLYTEYTGVLREYRNRQIALALKLLSVRFAKGYGAPYMSTRNDATNISMLAVNRKLGYYKHRGRYWLVRECTPNPA